MRAFNLEQAKAGKPVCTRDGLDVRILCFDRVHDCAPIVALARVRDDYQELQAFLKDGRTFTNHGSKDLFMKAEKRTGWVNIYEEGGGNYYPGARIYETEPSALENVGAQYKATVKLGEWEE